MFFTFLAKTGRKGTKISPNQCSFMQFSFTSHWYFVVFTSLISCLCHYRAQSNHKPIGSLLSKCHFLKEVLQKVAVYLTSTLSVSHTILPRSPLARWHFPHQWPRGTAELSPQWWNLRFHTRFSSQGTSVPDALMQVRHHLRNSSKFWCYYLVILSDAFNAFIKRWYSSCVISTSDHSK